MKFLRRIRNKWAPVLRSAPTRVKPTEESKTLAEKYRAKLEWMREKGIKGVFEEKRKGPLRDDSKIVQIDQESKDKKAG